MERFWSKADQSDPDGCWPWLRPLGKDGYGRFHFDGGPHLAHRIAYLLVVGEVPLGLELDHLCRNRACVNPDHLEPVTRRENIRRGIRGALTTHCPQGHAYDEVNTHVTRRGTRVCRACHREKERARYHRHGRS